MEEKIACQVHITNLMFLQHSFLSVFGTVDTKSVVSSEFKNIGSKVYILETKLDKDFLPDFEDLKEYWK